MSTIKHHSLFPSALIAGLAGALLGFIPIRNWDTWWHLAMGQLVERFHAVPIANHITYGVSPETPSVLHEWLAQWILARIDGSLGIEGVLTLRNLLVTCGLFLSLAMMREASSRTQLITGALATTLVMSVTFATPAVLAVPLFALCASCVHRATLDPRSASLSRKVKLACMLLPVVSTALWANLDIAFGLIPLLIAFALLHACLYPAKKQDQHSDLFDRIGWCSSLILSLAVAPLINPRGAELLPHVYRVLLLYPMHPDAPLWAHLFSASHAPELLLVACTGAWLVWLATRQFDVRRFVLFLALFLPLTLFALRPSRREQSSRATSSPAPCSPSRPNRSSSGARASWSPWRASSTSAPRAHTDTASRPKSPSRLWR